MNDVPDAPLPPPAPRRTVLERWFAIDARSLVALRVSLGLLVAADVALRLLDVVAHYSDRGVLPRDVVGTVRSAHWSLRVFFLDGSAAWSASLLVLMLVLAACLVVGYRTRPTTVLLWWLLASLHARNPVVLNGGDDLLRVLLLWTTLLPLGAWASVDRGRRTEPAAPAPFLSWATAGIQLQVAAVYLFTWALKSGLAWRDGSAVWMALNVDRLATPLGRAMLAYPGVLEVATHAVFWLELAAPLALFWPWGTARVRLVVVAALAAMHLGFVAFLGIGHFPFVSLAALWVFVPGAAWDRVRPLPAAPSGARLAPAPATQVLAAALLVFVLAWNVSDTLGYPRPVPATARALFLTQRWSMFAPQPTAATGWFVLQGEAADGTLLELFPTLKGGEPVAFTTAKPSDVPGLYPRYRWNRHFSRLMGGRLPEVATATAAYACGLADVPIVRIVLMSEHTHQRAAGSAPRPVDVAAVVCPP